MRRIVIPTALALLLGLVLAACGGNAGNQGETPAVSTDRAQLISQNMLVAYNSGDYQVEAAGVVQLTPVDCLFHGE
jgi:hypothetical protein